MGISNSNLDHSQGTQFQAKRFFPLVEMTEKAMGREVSPEIEMGPEIRNTKGIDGKQHRYRIKEKLSMGRPLIFLWTVIEIMMPL